MGKKGNTRQGRLARTVFAVALSYVLALSAILLPVSRAHALERAKADAILGLVCADDSETLNTGKTPVAAHGHSMDCCVAPRMIALDAPAFTAINMNFVAPEQLSAAPVRFTQAQAQAPPVFVSQDKRSRAPPLSA